MVLKIKMLLSNIDEKFFYKRYSDTYSSIQKKTNFKEYILKFAIILFIISMMLYLVFPQVIYCLITGFVLTVFGINDILLNVRKLNYEKYILNQLTIYISQMAMLVTFNNVFSSLVEVSKILKDPIQKDLLNVIRKIESGKLMADSFKDFNEKYNNRIVTLFNQTLEIFDSHGDSDAEAVLQTISEEMNTLKIRKDKFLKYKSEWRLNFYIVLFLCLSMPVILKAMIPSIYINFMDSFGLFIMLIIFAINILIVKKVETIFIDQYIGEGGY